MTTAMAPTVSRSVGPRSGRPLPCEETLVKPDELIGPFLSVCPYLPFLLRSPRRAGSQRNDGHSSSVAARCSIPRLLARAASSSLDCGEKPPPHIPPLSENSSAPGLPCCRRVR